MVTFLKRQEWLHFFFGFGLLVRGYELFLINCIQLFLYVSGSNKYLMYQAKTERKNIRRKFASLRIWSIHNNTQIAMSTCTYLLDNTKSKVYQYDHKPQSSGAYPLFSVIIGMHAYSLHTYIFFEMWIRITNMFFHIPYKQLSLTSNDIILLFIFALPRYYTLVAKSGITWSSILNW